MNGSWVAAYSVEICILLKSTVIASACEIKSNPRIPAAHLLSPVLTLRRTALPTQSPSHVQHGGCYHFDIACVVLSSLGLSNLEDRGMGQFSPMDEHGLKKIEAHFKLLILNVAP